MVYLLVLARGTILAVDNPARQTFVFDLVGPDKVVNAVALNSVIVHTARIAGPMFAGGLIAVLGVAPCFLFNAMSFAAMLIALRGMDTKKLLTPERAPRMRGQVRAAIAEVRGNPHLKIPLLMMVVIGTLSFNFQVLLPLFAKFTWHGTATTYALLMAAMGVGAIAGALISGFRGAVSANLLVVSAALFGAAQLGAAVAPTEWAQLLVLVPLGAASVTFAAGVNSSLQLAAGEMRGRVMALYSVVFLGSTPIGAPLVGALAEQFGPRWGLVVGGVAALVTAAVAAVAYGRAAVPVTSDSRIRQTAPSSCLETRPRAGRPPIPGEPGEFPAAGPPPVAVGSPRRVRVS
jgi:MFS family permease